MSKKLQLHGAFPSKAGLSAFEVAQQNGFEGTEAEWLESLKADVDLSEYVKNTDIASSQALGLVRVNPTAYGIGAYANGNLYIVGAFEEEIAKKEHFRRPITPSSLDYAVKVGLTTNTIDLTDEEKTAAQTWLGVTEQIGSIETALDSIIEIQNGLIGGGTE